MAGAASAISNASRLDEVKFPEFTTKLVSDVFDALIGANIRQQAAYIELLQQTSKSLSAFINDTKDDIGPEEITQLLAKALPPPNANGNSAPTKVQPDVTLTAADATALNDAIAVPDAGLPKDNKVVEAGKLDNQDKYDAILDAVAVRIAATKYALLTSMVKQGMLRLVVDHGTIETKLNFHTYGSDWFSANSSRTTRDSFAFSASAKTGGLLSLWAKAAASTAFSTMTVSTASNTSSASASTTVDIYGGVKIDFHTDYLPLNPDQ